MFGRLLVALLGLSLATLSTATFGFGAWNTPTTCVLTRKIYNSSQYPETYNTVTLTGPDAQYFQKVSDTLSGRTLAPGQFATIAVKFRFTKQGQNEAHLNISGRRNNQNFAYIEYCIGTAEPEVILEFGARSNIESRTQRYDWVNGDPTPCTSTPMIIEGPQAASFTKIADTYSGKFLGPGEGGKVVIKAAPLSSGDNIAYLRHQYTMGDSVNSYEYDTRSTLKTTQVPLSTWTVGNGPVGHRVNASPFQWGFYDPVTLDPVTFTGADAAAFRFNPDPFGKTYPANQSITGTLQFKATRIGVHSAIMKTRWVVGDWAEEVADRIYATGVMEPKLTEVRMLAKGELWNEPPGFTASYIASPSDSLRKYRVKYKVGEKEFYSPVSGNNRGGTLSQRFPADLPRFTKHQVFNAKLQLLDGDGLWVETSGLTQGMIPLPIILVPGIHIFQGFGSETGDGEFPVLESFLQQKSRVWGSGPGYVRGIDDPTFPTLSTFRYYRNLSSFQSAGISLQEHVAKQMDATYSAKVIILAHSKGTLVTRFLLSRTTGYKYVKGVALACGPHTGAFSSLIPQFFPWGGDFTNLNPIYPSRWDSSLRRYVAYVNPELQSLNLAYMPSSVPVSFFAGDKASYAGGHLNTPWVGNQNGVGYMSTVDGDGCVPLDSQRGELFGPGMATRQRIIAFNTLPPLGNDNFFKYEGVTHDGFMEQTAVMNSLWNNVVLRYGNQ